MDKRKVTFLSEQHPVKLWSLSYEKRVRAAQGDSTGMLAGACPALISSKIKELKSRSGLQIMTKRDLHLKAVALFEGNQDAAFKWCNAPNRALNWKTPAEVIGTEEGKLMISSLILRIEHGVYS